MAVLTVWLAQWLAQRLASFHIDTRPVLLVVEPCNPAHKTLEFFHESRPDCRTAAGFSCLPIPRRGRELLERWASVLLLGDKLFPYLVGLAGGGCSVLYKEAP